MRTKLTVVITGTVVLAGTMSAQATAQNEGHSEQGGRARVYRIAVTVQSRDPRVKLMAVDLNRYAAAEVDKAADNTNAIIVVGSKPEAAQQARQHHADYLLTIEFSPESTASVEVGPGAGRPRDPEVYGSPLANMQGAMFVAWTILPLNGNQVKLHDSRYVRPMEYPLSSQTVGENTLAVIARRSVRDAAVAAIRKLKSKKGLP